MGTILDLHNVLFEQLERLNDKNIKGAELSDEIRRADAISKTAGQIINNGRFVLEAMRVGDEMELPEEYDTSPKLKKPETKKLPGPGERRPLLNRIT
jgi:hypothetical protein